MGAPSNQALPHVGHATAATAAGVQDETLFGVHEANQMALLREQIRNSEAWVEGSQSGQNGSHQLGVGPQHQTSTSDFSCVDGPSRTLETALDPDSDNKDSGSRRAGPAGETGDIAMRFQENYEQVHAQVAIEMDAWTKELTSGRARSPAASRFSEPAPCAANSVAA